MRQSACDDIIVRAGSERFGEIPTLGPVMGYQHAGDFYAGSDAGFAQGQSDVPPGPAQPVTRPAP